MWLLLYSVKVVEPPVSGAWSVSGKQATRFEVLQAPLSIDPFYPARRWDGRRCGAQTMLQRRFCILYRAENVERLLVRAFPTRLPAPSVLWISGYPVCAVVYLPFPPDICDRMPGSALAPPTATERRAWHGRPTTTA